MLSRGGHLKLSIKSREGSISQVEKKGLGWRGNPQKGGNMLVEEDRALLGSSLPPDLHLHSEHEQFSEGVDGYWIGRFEKI